MTTQPPRGYLGLAAAIVIASLVIGASSYVSTSRQASSTVTSYSVSTTTITNTQTILSFASNPPLPQTYTVDDGTWNYSAYLSATVIPYGQSNITGKFSLTNISNQTQRIQVNLQLAAPEITFQNGSVVWDFFTPGAIAIENVTAGQVLTYQQNISTSELKAGTVYFVSSLPFFSTVRPASSNETGDHLVVEVPLLVYS